MKTYILRRLPILIYSQQTAKQGDAVEGDPKITSIYFDSPNFELYSEKLDDKQVDASTVRLRWYGQLQQKPEISLEQKILYRTGNSEEKRFSIKDKYIQPLINGEYKMEKSVQKLERQGHGSDKVEAYKVTVNDLQTYIREKELQPVLRANYTRTAFQKPLDDRVRVSIDTEVAFIREDSLDPDRPCRIPEEWHRKDIDDNQMGYPFSNINKGEISRFPYAILEIKVKQDATNKTPKWVNDLTASHLVHKAPRFSKFVHGVASLFEDHVNSLPFWLSEVETDIRKDPQKAFEEEEQRRAKKAEDELVVGSLLGTTPKQRSQSFKVAVSSPTGRSYLQDREAAESSKAARSRALSAANIMATGVEDDAEEQDGNDEHPTGQNGYGTIKSVFPSFSLSRYAQSQRERNVQLPPGVVHPGPLIKDSGPLKVEPKVWLANERTFLKWQHICILLGGLAVGLYTSAGKNTLAEFMGIAYIVIAIFAGVWGYYMHFTRRNMILARSGKDFDNIIGPMIVSVALIVSLFLNFFFKVRFSNPSYLLFPVTDFKYSSTKRLHGGENLMLT